MCTVKFVLFIKSLGKVVSGNIATTPPTMRRSRKQHTMFEDELKGTLAKSQYILKLLYQVSEAELFYKLLGL